MRELRWLCGALCLAWVAAGCGRTGTAGSARVQGVAPITVEHRMDGHTISLDTTIQLEGRHVLIVEDIVDTGLTLASLRRLIEVRDPASVRTVALLDKAPRRIIEVPVEYRGFEVGDEFLLGYGLDWNGWYRNVRSLWAVMDLSELKRDHSSFAKVGHNLVGRPNASR